MTGIGCIMLGPPIYRNTKHCHDLRNNLLFETNIYETTKRAMSTVERQKFKFRIANKTLMLKILDKHPSLTRCGIAFGCLSGVNALIGYFTP